jgi:cytidyltransferase-like protein
METLMSANENLEKTEKWEKIVHAKSSLQSLPSQRVLFIGRWQPLHKGHLSLFNQALSEGKKILIAIRHTEVSEKNPYTSMQVADMIMEAYKDNDDVGVTIIPDISEVAFGRGVGYDVVEYVPPKEIADISATKIREKLKSEGKL